MRIAVINPYGNGRVYSGPALFARRLFRALAADHDVTLVLGRRVGDDDNPTWAGSCVPLMTFQRYSAAEQLQWSARSATWLLRNASDYDLVHIHGAAFFNLLAATAAIYRRSDYAVVALAAGNDLSRASTVARLPGLAQLRRLLVRRATIGFALSDDIAAEFVALGLAPDRVAALGNPVDTTLYKPLARSRPDRRATIRTLGFVGAVGHRKRAEVVLETVALLHGSGFPETKALFVGPFESTDYEHDFWARASRLGVRDSLEVVGYTDEVWRWMNTEMSVLLLPSSMEGLPGALVEAMASGLPSVVTDVGAMGRVVREAKAGFVAPAEALAISERVAEMWHDETLWAEFSAGARSYACAHFDVSSVADQYMRSVTQRRSKGERSLVS